MKHPSRETARSLAGDIVEAALRAADQGLELEPAAMPPGFAKRVAGLGFEHKDTAARSFASVAARLCAGGKNEDRFVDLVLSCANSASPDSALDNLDRFLENAGSPSVFLDTIGRAPPLIEMLTTVFGASRYMADILIRNPGYAYWMMEQRSWDPADTTSLTAWFRREAQRFRTREGKLGAVRRAQRQALLRIGVQDLLGDASIEETTGSLSQLADAVSQTVLEIVAEDDAVSLGFAVIAMGKLGGNELNYSSDIDLIYVSEDCDEGASAAYLRLAREFTSALTDVTEEGYLYRVDLRLRPDGKAGPLVNPETSMRIYYENRGRPWEFQAMLKARTIAGDHELGGRVLDGIRALVFNPALSHSPLEDIARMRAQIKESIGERERAFNIKLMEGGIRDIEFTVQTLQLMHGSRNERLRTGNTLSALDEVGREKLLKEWEVDNLRKAYCFFRLVEHRVQMMHQIKTHSVPESTAEIALLARRVSNGPLGSYGVDEFLEALSRHLNNVRTFGESFFAGEEVHPHSVLLMLPEDDERATAIIGHYGLSDAPRAIRVLHTMAYGSFPHLHDRRTRAVFEELLPFLLEDVAESPDPDRTLGALANIAEACRSESAFYRLLVDSPPIRHRVVRLAGLSSYLAKRLRSQMEVLEPLLVGPAAMLQDLEQPLAEWEGFDKQAAAEGGKRASSRMEQQRRRLDRGRLASFIIDSEEGTPGIHLSQTIARSTRAVITAALDRAVGQPGKVAVFALGSYAVGEPRIGSDLDLIVVSDGADIPLVTRDIQLVNQWFTGGGIVKLDFRLRGEGASAPLVQDVSFYSDYLERRMSLWERVAFAKCAHWWGSERVAAAFFALLRKAVATPLSKDEVTSLFEMRRSIEFLARTIDPVLETKRSAGGRYDIEYMTAIGMASCTPGAKYRFSRTTDERLAALYEHKMISKRDLTALRDAISLFTAVEHALELQEITPPRPGQRAESVGRYLDRALDLLGHGGKTNTRDRLVRAKERVRGALERFLKKKR